MIRVTVAREHVDTHSMYLTDIHGSEKWKRVNLKWTMWSVKSAEASIEQSELTFHLRLQRPYMKSSAHITPSAYVLGGQSASSDLS